MDHLTSPVPTAPDERLTDIQTLGLVNRAIDSVTQLGDDNADVLLMAQAHVMLTHYRVMLEAFGMSLSGRQFATRIERDEALIQYQCLCQRVSNVLVALDHRSSKAA